MVRKIRIQIDLDDELLEWVNEQSKKLGISRSSFCRMILLMRKENEVQKKDVGEK